MPSVVIIPTSAPLCVSAMFVATVVPWRRLSTSARPTPAFAQSSPDALAGAARRVVRRRRDLVDRDPARLLVDEDQVGERAADVDADALHGLLRSALRVCAPGAFGAKPAAPVTVLAQFRASSVTVRAQRARFFAIR